MHSLHQSAGQSRCSSSSTANKLKRVHGIIHNANERPGIHGKRIIMNYWLEFKNNYFQLIFIKWQQMAEWVRDAFLLHHLLSFSLSMSSLTSSSPLSCWPKEFNPIMFSLNIIIPFSEWLLLFHIRIIRNTIKMQLCLHLSECGELGGGWGGDAGRMTEWILNLWIEWMT